MRLDVHPSFRQWITSISADANVGDQDQGLKGHGRLSPGTDQYQDAHRNTAVGRYPHQMLDELGSSGGTIEGCPVASSHLAAAGTHIARQETPRNPSTKGREQPTKKVFRDLHAK